MLPEPSWKNKRLSPLSNATTATDVSFNRPSGGVVPAGEVFAPTEELITRSARKINAQAVSLLMQCGFSVLKSYPDSNANPDYYCDERNKPHANPEQYSTIMKDALLGRVLIWGCFLFRLRSIGLWCEITTSGLQIWLAECGRICWS
jgi:hypothetical protein